MWSKQEKYHSSTIGAAQANCSSMHATWHVLEWISDAIEDGKNANVAMLNIEKAFDSAFAIWKTEDTNKMNANDHAL